MWLHVSDSGLIPSLPCVPCIRTGSTVEWQIRAPLLLMCDIALSSSQACTLPACFSPPQGP